MLRARFTGMECFFAMKAEWRMISNWQYIVSVTIGKSVLLIAGLNMTAFLRHENCNLYDCNKSMEMNLR